MLFRFMLICLLAGVGLNAAEPAFDNGGFEKTLWKGIPAGWGGKAVMTDGKSQPPNSALDTEEFKEGGQSLKLELTPQHKIVIVGTQLGKVIPGKVYEISFWCRITGDCRIALREDHIMAGEKWNEKLFKNFITVQGASAWKKITGKVTAADGDDKLGITMFIDKGPGTVWLDGFEIQEYVISAGDEVAFRMTPDYYTQNNIFSLSRQAPLMLYLTCANKAQHKSVNPRTVIELPEEIQLLSCGYDSREYKPAMKFNKNGQAYVRYEYTLGLPGIVMRAPDFSQTTFDSVVPLLFTDAAASDKVYKCFISYQDDKLTSQPSEFDIRISGAIAPAATPKYFSTGIHSGTGVEFYGKPLTDFMSFYKSCGFNTIYLPEVLRAGGVTPEGFSRNPAPLYKAADETGVSTYVSTNCLVNGYMLRYTAATANAPDEVKLKNASGAIDKSSFDPAYISRKGEWYVKGVNSVVESAVKLNAKGIWINWEPWMFIGDKGSFTELSLKDFAKFAGLPENEVLSAPPLELFRKYRDKLYLFQSAQCGTAMKALMEIIRKRGEELNHPLETILCTGSAFFREPGSIESEREYRRTFMTEQWMKYFNTVSSWYYLYFNSDDYLDARQKKLIDAGCRIPETNILQPSSHFTTLREVEQTMEFIRGQCAADGRATARYIHLSQNLQCDKWVVTPSEIRIQMLAAFLGGADGIDLYYFPQGYDGEYWRNAAGANAEIAMFEDFVCKGKKLNSNAAITPLTALFKSSEHDFSRRLAVRTFEKDGRILAAVCNFDFNSSAPAELSLTLPENQKYVLTAPYEKEYYRGPSNPWLTAAGLRNIPVLIPPLSVKFLVIEPWQDGKDYGSAVDLNKLRQENEKLIPQLDRRFREQQKEVDKIQREIKGESQEAFSSAAKFKPLTDGGFKTELKEQDGKYLLTVATVSQQITITPENGAIISQWQAGDKTMISPGNGSQMFGKDKFYSPAGYEGGIAGTYQLESQSINGGNLNLVFRKDLAKGALKGLTIYKTFIIANDKPDLTLSYRFVNNGREAFTAGFWSGNISEISNWKYKPEMQTGSRQFSAADLMATTYCRNGSSGITAIEGLLKQVKTEEIKADSAILSSAAGKVKISTAADRLAGILFWAMGKQETDTLEFFFIPQTMKPGAEMQIRLNYSSLE
ncbi:MAG: hypothetical protein WCV67_18835 [Victivallaceae bacterium]|jgi:hypothetical protein